ncbi:DUF3080 family protein [Ferrimonas balearica]|uniref:DUF3080 family protein n=1 Tax=Ferrimonas balearica TaxID=44012 RepID=UPI001C9954C3|nr:DUF3080 family protein [Ferrimonas balearica]MBY5920486.1 DUF3080 domain-containing protein [Ferrimonas balearica]MBY5996829.1 DUF3080 domain-containing protein [Ferrimonas balearica]
MWQWPLKLLLLVLVSGCQPGPDTALDDYLSRLERVLETERPSIALSPPDRPSRHQFEPDDSLTVSLLAPLALKPCGVLPLIAQHNAQLGRVAAPSQQLLYHLELGYRLYHCDPATLDKEGQALRERLLKSKIQQLEQGGARLFLLSDELWFNLGAESAPWRFEGVTQVEQSLTQLAETKASLLHWDSLPLDDGQLEESLAVLHHAQLPRSLHRSMLNSIQTLNQAAMMLARAEELPCHSEAMNILPNILISIYGERIQPLLSQVQNADHRLTPPLRQLLSPWPSHPYFDFYLGEEPGQLRHEFYLAIQQHTLAWQTLLNRCDRSPADLRG